MMSIDEIYKQGLARNDYNLKFWENHLFQLKSLDFNIYADKLKVSVLVPMGSRILFRGELQHTNEVTVALGAEYFAKCSVAQAEILRQHRIKETEVKIEMFTKEKEFLENRLTFAKQNVFANDGQEILEIYTEEEEKAWREKHRENVRKYKQSEANEDIKPQDNISDAELWERLEELELQEELENDLMENYNEIVDKRKENTFLQNEETLLRNSIQEENNNQHNKETNEDIKHQILDNKQNMITEVEPNTNTNEVSKHDLLQKVLDKQTELEIKLQELKNKEREQSKTEEDLIARLDEMEQLEELEDEMERLEDILETGYIETDDSSEATSTSNKSESSTLKKSISFADDSDDAETLEIDFSHSDMEPTKEPYDPKKGIMKPSDVYVAYSGLYDNKTTSILKKSKYDSKEVTKEESSKSSKVKQRRVMFEEKPQTLESSEPEEIPVERTIVIKDVVENAGVNQHHIEGGARPTSLFKKKRMQKK